MSTLYLCGAGNPEGVRLALSVQRERPRWDLITLLDDDPLQADRDVLGVEVAGPFSLLGNADAERDFVVNLVARTARGRAAARERIRSFGIPFTPLVHPGVDTLGAELAEDVIVYPQAIVGPESVVEAGSVVLMGGMVGHESRVGPGCIIAANAVLNARVVLGRGVYVGTNATVLPELEVGDWATVGAGSVVIAPVPSGTTVMGVPAETLIGAPVDDAPYEAPGEGTEETVARLWRETLGRTEISVRESFFRAGGDSLRMLEIVEGVRREFGVEIPPRAFFHDPTIAGIARLVESALLRGADADVVEALLRDVEGC